MSSSYATSDSVLRSANHALAQLNDGLRLDTRELFANVFILGLPRSGTTYASQLIFQHMHIGCTNNLIARFWMAPYIGCILSREVLGVRKGTDYSSAYGSTNMPWEPHEFSWFWHDLLGGKAPGEWDFPPSDEIDWDRARARLCALNTCLDAPIVHKPLEMAGYYLPEMAHALKRSVFVYIDRSPLDVACSIYEARIRRNQDPNRWWSSRVPDKSVMARVAKEPYWIQIPVQVMGLRAMYTDRLREVDPLRIVRVRYEDLVSGPGQLIEQLHVRTTALGAGISISSMPAPSPLPTPQHSSMLIDQLSRGFELTRDFVRDDGCSNTPT